MANDSAAADGSAGADRLTQEALSHWYVRLLANGITYADASDVIPRVSSWREWCRLPVPSWQT